MRTSCSTIARAAALAALLTACGGEHATSEAQPATESATRPAAAAPEQAAVVPDAPSPATGSAIPAAEAPPAGAPSLPGTELPSFGTFRVGAPAFFPTLETAEKLRAGNLADAGMTYFRGVVVRHDAATATVGVRDLQNREYDVPASYVLQAREPVTRVEPGQVYRGVRFNRPELVMVTSATADDRGRVPTLGLAGFMPDAVRAGSDELAALVPVVDGGIGSQAVCRGPDGVRGYTVLRRAPGHVLGYDGSFIRVLPDASCRFAPLRPELAAGDRVFYVHATSHREATVRSVDASTGAVQVAYAWGSSEREDVARFGSIVRELPPE